MTNTQLIELTKKLVAIPSTGDNPDGLRQAYNFMIGLLRASGKDITIEEFESNGKPSFMAYKGGVRPKRFKIILSVHVDVVPGKPHQYDGKVKNGKLYGRGVHDEKAACVILADLFCEFIDKVPYALGLQVVTDEEYGGADGALYQIQQGVRGDFVICAECGRRPDVHEIANEAKGIVIADISFDGSAAHGAYPWKGDNAAPKAAHFIHALHQRFPSPSQESPETTFSVTSMSAHGGSHTRIPDSATVRLDIRYAPDDLNFEDRTSLQALIKSIDPNAKLDIVLFDSPLYCSPDNPLLQALKTSAEAIEGAPFTFARRHATSDGRHFGDVGDQACEFGVAGDNQHGDNEHITLTAFSNYRNTIRHFLEKTTTMNTNEVALQPKPKNLILT
ncbi:MAG TPA: M20/M25/M40 family metallo-hydrolase [Candidatus Saccharimonadales bacterium]|nr:M20/M25/M40 family metallo-hydrolase [Candidatus Saccharimonadales bacterium]